MKTITLLANRPHQNPLFKIDFIISGQQSSKSIGQKIGPVAGNDIHTGGGGEIKLLISATSIQGRDTTRACNK